MNILFALFGDFTTTSAIPVALYARELRRAGHACAAAVPSGLETASRYESPAFQPVLYDDVIAAPESVFPDGRPADVIHACTPREVVRRFVTAYMARWPTPLVILLEDNERWIALQELKLDEAALARSTRMQVSAKLPDVLSHPFHYDSFIGLADVVAVIQDKLRVEVPPWVHCETVMIGVDTEFFSPRPPDRALRSRYGVAEPDKIIVYHGGMNAYTRPRIKTLCSAVGLINQQGCSCRLLRSGPTALDFLEEMPPATASAVSDLGVLPLKDLPDLLALADVFVQPGQNDPFERLRLPGKVPEFLSMGRPVIMPDTNIAHLCRDGADAVLLRTGSAAEIAAKCIELFSDPRRADAIGRNGRLLAKKHFDFRSQARRLESVYMSARDIFNSGIASETWRAEDDGSPSLLLAHKLRLLADASRMKNDRESADMLTTHATSLELMQRRVEGLEEVLQDREKQVAFLHQEVARRDGQIATLARDIAERDGQITTLQREVGQRDGQIATLHGDVVQRDDQIATLNRDVVQRDGQIAALHRDIAERDRQIATLSQEVVNRDVQTASILSSTSWRITAPVRSMKRQIRRVFGFADGSRS